MSAVYHDSDGKMLRKGFKQEPRCTLCHVLMALLDWSDRTKDWRVKISVVIGLSIVAAVWIVSMVYIAGQSQPMFAFAMLVATFGGWPAIRNALRQHLKKLAL